MSRAVARRAGGARRGDPRVGGPQGGTGYQLQTLQTCTRLHLSLLANSRMHMGWVAVSRLREIPEVTENPDKATRSARKTPLRFWGWWGGSKAKVLIRLHFWRAEPLTRLLFQTIFSRMSDYRAG